MHIVLEDDLFEKIETVKKIENLSTTAKTIKYLISRGFDSYINQDEIDTLKIVKDNGQKLNSISEAEDVILIKIAELTDLVKNK